MSVYVIIPFHTTDYVQVEGDVRRVLDSAGRLGR